MPWKGQTVEERRKEFVMRAIAKEKAHSALCREYGISRPTGYKWIERHQSGEPMEDRSHAPNHRPNQTSKATEDKIVRLREKHPAIGAKKLKKMLENDGIIAPAYSTINAILHRNGLITPEASRIATPCKRFEKGQPNEMWQADFKGHFAMKNGQRCHPLTIVDDYSRFCVCLSALSDQRYEGVAQSLLSAFEVFGLPETLLCDNGNPWGTQQAPGYTRLEVWLMDLGILTKHGRPMHPQTQGKNERFNGTLLREHIRHQTFEDNLQAQQNFDEYQHFYNVLRPHHALNLETPSTRYCKSFRKLPQNIESWEYGWVSALRMVHSGGYIKFDGHEYFLSQSLSGKQVGLIESDDEEPGVFLVLYRQFCVAKINVGEKEVLSRRPTFFKQ